MRRLVPPLFECLNANKQPAASLLSLALKQVEKVSLGLSKGNKLHLAAPLKLTN